MSGVSQIRMQAAVSRLNSDSGQLGAKPSGSASPGGFENFLASLNQSTIKRLDARSATDKKPVVNSDPNASSMQNLPTKDSQDSKSANNADQIQLLMSQLMAQTMPNQVPVQQNSELQGLEPKQAALIIQALSRALKASGRVDEQSSQALALMQAFQSQMQSAQIGNLAINQAADQAKEQLSLQNAAQIASAIQNAAQKNGVTLPPELQAQLNELVNQATPGSIKLIAVEPEVKADPAKATTIQNLTDVKNHKIVDGAIQDKTLKLKNSDGLNPLNFGEKSTAVKTEAVKAGGVERGQAGIPNDDLSSKLPSQNFEPSLNPMQTGIPHADISSSSQNRIEMRAPEISLSSGPLYAEIMNSAKSGGGRIMLEITPPEQETIRIDLRINANGQAHLIVEGASDATKARLDQGGQNLKNEFSQMGLNLSLDLRQGNQSQQASQQGFENARQGNYSGLSPASQSSTSSILVASTRSGDNRESSNTVHLYA